MRHPALQRVARHPWFTAFGVLALAVVVLVLLWDWNWFNGPLERQVEKRTGREFDIGGDLDVDLDWVPTIRAEQVRFGNAPWSKEPTMASADLVEFEIELKPLFRRTVRIPELRLSQPVLKLEMGPGRVGNWKFGEPGATPAQYRRLWVDNGKLAFLDAGKKTDIKVDVDSEAPKAGEAAPPITAKGGGRWEGNRFTVEGRAASPLALRDADSPYR
ncbi:MAG: AsmA family protein, partial [Lysobacter sp.]